MRNDEGAAPHPRPAPAPPPPRTRRPWLRGAALALVALGLTASGAHLRSREARAAEVDAARGQCDTARAWSRTLEKIAEPKDGNSKQIPVARRLGIEPLEDDAAFERSGHVEAGRLVRLASNGRFRVDRMEFGKPYLIPEAVALLERIGDRVRARLRDKGLPAAAFTVTSGLRTRAAQAALDKVNPHASARSAHFHGTTFDISHNPAKWSLPLPPAHGALRGGSLFSPVLERLGVPPLAGLDAAHGCIREALRYVLRAELVAMREEGLLLVTEESGNCYHVTVKGGADGG
jgi:hypothetical protein